MKITAHCIIKNEDQWIWFALKSVLPFVDQILIFDTGSNDRTQAIVKSINSDKIVFVEKGPVTGSGLAKLRNEQIQKTKTDWFLIVDGDEVWPADQLKKLLEAASHADSNIKAFINRTRNSIGDVFHYLPREAGGYQLANVKGSLNIRLIRKSPTLQVIGEYPLESYCDQDGPLEKQTQALEFVDCWYLHTSFLVRSSFDKLKTSGSLGRKKIPEIGLALTREELPEVLFDKDRPPGLRPLTKRGWLYELIALILAPILKLKRGVKH